MAGNGTTRCLGDRVMCPGCVGVAEAHDDLPPRSLEDQSHHRSDTAQEYVQRKAVQQGDQRDRRRPVQVQREELSVPG